MANPFDQFDQQTAPKPANPFDQFDPATPSPLEKFWDAVNYGVNRVGTQAIKGTTSVVEAPAALGKLGTAGGNAIAKAVGLTPQPQQQAPGPFDTAALTAQMLRDWLFKRAPEVNAETRLGKIADAGIQAVTGGMLFPGGTSFGMMVPNAVGGMTQEAVGGMEGVKGTALEPWLRFGSGALAAGATSVPFMMRETAPAMIARRTNEMTPQDWAMAKQLQAQSNQPGMVPLMAHEAMTPNGAAPSPVVGLFGDVAASPAGGKIQKFAADRVPTMKSSIATQAGKIAPPIADPKQADMALARAAEKAVQEPLNARSAAAKTHFTAAAGDLVDPQVKADAITAVTKASQGAAPGGVLAKKLESLQSQIEGSTTVGQIDDVYKTFKTIAESKAWDGEVVPDHVRAAIKPILKDMRAGLGATNPEYAAGMSKYASGPWGKSPLTADVEAAQQSGASQIASAVGGKPDQAMGQFGKWILDPENARPTTVRADMARLMKQDPEAAKSALRLFIENHADAAFKRTQAGEPVKGGANFTKTIAGTDLRRANLMAAIEGATGNKTTAAGFSKLLDILDRTGVTPNVGSPTMQRGANAAEASVGHLTPVFEAANIAKGGPMGPLARKYADLRFGKAYGQLADLTTRPDGVKLLHELALLNPASAKAKALAAQIVQGAMALEGSTP